MEPSLDKWVKDLLASSDESVKMTEKQTKILLAAIETFSEKGYAGTSTSEIAQKAGVAEGTIFRHYKTKKDLLLSVVAPVITKLIGPFVLRDFTKMLDAPYETYEDFLRALFRNRMEFAKNNLPILKILIQEIPFHDELRTNFLSVIGTNVFSRLTKVVDHYKAKGMLTKSIPSYAMIRFTASTMIGLIASLVFLLPEKDWDYEQELDHTINMIMNGLANPQSDQAP